MMMCMTMVSTKIALFDSGLGGLSVVREVRRLLPGYDLVYFADTAYCPYGMRSPDEVCARTLLIGRWLMGQGAGMVVVACNTASSATLEVLRAELPLPIVGMEPGLKPAVQVSRNQRVGVLATANTLAGSRFAALVERHAEGAEVFTQPCPGLVERVEAGELEHPATRALLEGYLQPLLARGVDTIVLGCTHYPFLYRTIADVVGPERAIIDTGPAVARQVVRVVEHCGLLPGQGMLEGWTSGEADQVGPIAWRLMGEVFPMQHARL